MKYPAASVLALFLALVCLSVGRAQGPPPPPAAAAPEYPLSAWKQFSAAEHGFSVWLPTEPAASSEKNSTALGDVTIHTWRISTRDGRYQVMSVRFPFTETDPQKIAEYFDRTQTQISGRFNGRPEGVRDFDLDGVPGREFRLKPASGVSTLRMRLFYKLDRVWILLSDTINRELALREPDIFHDSFRLVATVSAGQEGPPPADLKAGIPGQVMDGPPAGPLIDASAVKWQTHSSAGGRFTVTVPSEPSEQQADAPSEFGEIRVNVLQSLSLAPLAVCTVIYSDYPDRNVARKVYAKRRESMTGKGKVLSETEVALDGHPGSELRLETGNGPGGKPGRMVNRVFLVENRIYQVMTVSQETDMDSAELRRFRESFRLIPQK